MNVQSAGRLHSQTTEAALATPGSYYMTLVRRKPTCLLRRGMGLLAVAVSVFSVPNLASSSVLSHRALSEMSHESATSYYVAVGDSYSSGEGNPGQKPTPWISTTGTPWKTDDGCHRSVVAYPMLVSSWLNSDKGARPMRLRFLACSGATTGDLWNSGTTPDGKEGPQLNGTSALAGARIVTVSIGGNDLHFSDILTNCVVGPPQHTCDAHSNDGWIARLHKNIESLEPVLVATYRQIEALSPDSALYVVGYPYLFPPKPSTVQQNISCPRRTLIAPNGIGYLAYNEQALAAVVATAARESGAHFINPNAPGPHSFIGHDVCSKNSWINRPNLVAHVVYSFHPDAAGQAAYAALIEAAITRSATRSGTGDRAIQVAAGGESECALLTDETVKCAGSNDVGQIGDGTTPQSSLPLLVKGLSGVRQISAGFDSPCALLKEGAVKCWGFGLFGALGDGLTTNSDVPLGVSGLSGVSQISVGGFQACALLTAGTVKCWGANAHGELGDGTNYDSSVPVAVAGLLGRVEQIASGWDHSCAVLTGGTVKCWGDNDFGQLGDGTDYDSWVPVSVIALRQVKQIVAGNGYTCALVADGKVRCWGLDASGQLGDGRHVDAWTPQAVAKITGAVQISAGDTTACALAAGDEVLCWGDGTFGALGNGKSVDSSTPLAVRGLSGVGQISVGGFQACAVLTVGTVKCWGNNQSGQLGIGMTTLYSSLPVAFTGL